MQIVDTAAMSPEPVHSSAGEILEMLQQPPLEIIEQGQDWVVQTYHRGDQSSRVVSIHDSQIDATRAAKTEMEANNHPCILRWNSPRSVGNLYWNPLFECVEVRYDELVDTWAVVPSEGACAVATCPSRETACDVAKQIQRKHDFKRLRVYKKYTDEFEEREHRFLRHDITKSGVVFDPDAVNRQLSTEAIPPSNDEPEGTVTPEKYASPATPGRLGVSIPDLTKVKFISTDGMLHRYATPWGDGTNAEILAVSRKHSDNTEIRESFDRWLTRWRATDDHRAVATIHESGTEPVPWVAYEVGNHTLEAIGTELSAKERIAGLKRIGAAINTVRAASDDPVCGLHPKWVHICSDNKERFAAVSQLGIKWGVQRAGGTHEPTPFTAPEQLDGTVDPTTAVYQFGAVAYALLCESLPITGQNQTATLIESGSIPPARPADPIPSEVGAVIDQAVETAPADRHDSIQVMLNALQDAI